MTLAPNCPPHGVQGAPDSFRLRAHPRGETYTQVSGTKGPSLCPRPPDLSPSATGPGAALPFHSGLCPSVPLSLLFALAVEAYLFLQLLRSLRKPLKSCLVLLGKQALQSIPGDTGHQTGQPGSAAASGSRGVEGSPRSVRQEEGERPRQGAATGLQTKARTRPRRRWGQERVKVPEPEEEASEARTQVPTPGSPLPRRASAGCSESCEPPSSSAP